MAYVDANLTLRVGESGGTTPERYTWDYSTSNNMADVLVNGYFDAGSYKLRRGDFIRVTANDGKIMLRVTTSAGGDNPNNVDVINVAYVDGTLGFGYP